MRIRNNSNELLILNIYKRQELVDVASIANYNLNGIRIPAKSETDIQVCGKEILYFSNIALTKANYIILASECNEVKCSEVNMRTLDVWVNNHEAERCHSRPYCKDSINLVLEFKLHDLLIWKLYSGKTYFAIMLFFSVMILVVLFIIIKLISKL
jgi:hypothetical protein